MVAEYRFQVISYEHINRDSTTQFILAGFDHAFSSRVVSFSARWCQLRDYQDFGEKDSPYFEGTISYALGKDTSRFLDEPLRDREGDVGLSPTRTTFRTGLQSTHRFTARISGSVNLYYTRDDYDSTTIPGTTRRQSFLHRGYIRRLYLFALRSYPLSQP